MANKGKISPAMAKGGGSRKTVPTARQRAHKASASMKSTKAIGSKRVARGSGRFSLGAGPGGLMQNAS